MIIDYHKNFAKRYKKLDKNLQLKIDEKIDIFTKNPFDPILRNHPLKGKLLGKRAFSVTGDCRVIFEEIDNYFLVIILDVGTHNQVY